VADISIDLLTLETLPVDLIVNTISAIIIIWYSYTHISRTLVNLQPSLRRINNTLESTRTRTRALVRYPVPYLLIRSLTTSTRSLLEDY